MLIDINANIGHWPFRRVPNTSASELRALLESKGIVGAAVAKSDAKNWSVVFRHPLGKLTCRFDKKNTEKLRNWLAGEQAQAVPAE